MTRIATRDGTAYDVHDTGRGPVLVLLHGFAGASRTWAPVEAALASGRRLVAIDLLGHGGSDAPAPQRHSVERQADDLAWLIAASCDGPVDVLGYSFGARVALWLAATSPATVRRLVLESPSAGIADAAARAARVAADERWAGLLEAGDMAVFHEAWERQPVFASRSALDPERREVLRMEHLDADPRGLAASLRGAGQGVMAPLHDRLAAIEAPSLVVAGGLDALGCERAIEVQRLLPASRLEILPDAGHAPHLERPEAFARLVTESLSPAMSETSRGDP